MAAVSRFDSSRAGRFMVGPSLRRLRRSGVDPRDPGMVLALVGASRPLSVPAGTDSGHEKLPGDGHEAARWRT